MGIFLTFINMNPTLTFTDRIIQSRIASHLLFWGGFLLTFTLLATLNSGTISNNLINYLSLLPAQMMAAYTLIYFQVPKLLLKKKYAWFALSFLFSIYLFAVIARLSIIYIAEPFTRTDFEQESILEVITDPAYLFAVYFPVVYVIVFLLFALKTIKERFEERHQMQALEQEKTANELKFLKAQIHPHFLFNTLNSLYALTLAKSDAAPQVVVKLSELLDYILYQCNEPSIAIEQEIDLLQGYIDLETLRYGEKLELTFEHDLGQKGAKVAPLILLSIVENAFKHGASGNPINPKIHIHLKVENEQLNFSVFNTKTTTSTNKLPRRGRSGIGSINVSRQLALNYPNKHELKIEDTPNTYLVQLTINLK